MRILLAIGLFILASPAFGETIRTYDRNSNYQGQFVHQGNRWVEVDKNGNVLGSFERSGDRTVHKDKNNNPRGYTTFKP